MLHNPPFLKPKYHIKTIVKSLLLITIVLQVFFAKANIRLSSVLSNNMVLQQKTEVKLWGWGNPGEKISIITSWNNSVDTTVTNGNGKWQLKVKTPSAGGPYTISFKGYNTIKLENILIGEVWVCSGQSNMEYNFNWSPKDFKNDITNAANSYIRFFNIPRTTAENPQEDCTAKWEACDSNTIKSFSAVAYFFGKKLNSQLNIPIGLIGASWGGTPAEVWTPADIIQSDTILKQASLKQRTAKGWPVTPGYAHNGMIAPLTNYNIVGAIWYQGESNTGMASSYGELLSAMINSWRKKWSNEFPFYIVQIAPYHYGNKNIGALLREQQLKVSATLNKTGIIVTNDLAEDTNNIHPKNKYDVGYRLANISLSDLYQQNIAAKNPVFSKMNITDDKVLVDFNFLDKGIVIKGEKLYGAFIAEKNKLFYPAEGRIINGKTLELWNVNVKQPVAVRYAFSNTAVGNLFGKNGLPAASFRSDNWEVDTTSY